MPVILLWRGALLGSSHALPAPRLSVQNPIISQGSWAKEGPHSSHCLHCVLEGQCGLSHRLSKVPVYSFASIFYSTFRKKGGVGGDVYGKKVDQGSFQVHEL